MATLTRYNSFKSLKKTPTTKAKTTIVVKKIAEEEVEAFFQLLSKKKVNAKKV